MIQIQFLDKNAVGALLPVYSMKPECVIFLYDTKIISERSCKEVEEAIKRPQPKTAVQFVRANMLQMDNIKEVLEQIINTYQNKEIQIDITGGSEIMTACGLLTAQMHGLTSTYVDFKTGYVFDVFTQKELAPIVPVRLEDYLTALGGKYLSASRHTPEESDFERILSMAEFIFANEKKWDKFFTHMIHGYSAKGVMEFSMEEAARDRDCMEILDAFLDRGFAIKKGKDRYSFASEADKEYMTVSGIWLELYIYIQAKQCFDEVYMGVDIDWNKRDICQSRDNEIDVVIMKNSQPIFISCKMRPVEKETVYEIYSMARRLGGSYAKSLIATTVDVRSHKDERSSIYLRMAKMKVGLIEAKDFKKKTSSQVFADAVRMTE